MEIRILMASMLTALASTCVGCSTEPTTDYSKVELVSAGGTVTLDGSPVAAAVVTFEAVDTGTFSFALTDDQGRYQLQFDSVKSGVVPWPKIVQISTTRKLLGLNTSDEIGDDADSESSAVEKIPDCYNKNSKLKVEVQSDSRTFNFELKTDCSTTGGTV